MMMQIVETNEEYAYGALLVNILDDFIFEECIEVNISLLLMKTTISTGFYLYLFVVIILQMMWFVRTNGITLDEIYNVEPIESFFEQEKLTGNLLNIMISCVRVISVISQISLPVGNQAASSSSSGTVNCPICNEIVSGRRFAPHLEKCMNGGKRGSKRHYDYLHDDVFGGGLGNKSLSKAKSMDSLELQDSFPHSLVVKIKLKNGGEYLSL